VCHQVHDNSGSGVAVYLHAELCVHWGYSCWEDIHVFALSHVGTRLSARSLKKVPTTQTVKVPPDSSVRWGETRWSVSLHKTTSSDVTDTRLCVWCSWHSTNHSSLRNYREQRAAGNHHWSRSVCTHAHAGAGGIDPPGPAFGEDGVCDERRYNRYSDRDTHTWISENTANCL